MTRSRTLRVARVLRPHGVRGELLVAPLTDQPASRFQPGQVLSGAPDGERVVEAGREMGSQGSGRWLLRLRGVDTRDAAEALRGAVLSAEVDTVAGASEEYYHDQDLYGMEVRSGAGELLGTVAGVEHLPAQDLLRVNLVEGPSAPVLVPFVAALVPQVDLELRVVVVDAPPGLLGPGPDDVPG